MKWLKPKGRPGTTRSLSAKAAVHPLAGMWNEPKDALRSSRPTVRKLARAEVLAIAVERDGIR